jgi:hypothetical protein
MSTNTNSWQSNLSNGLVAPDRKPAPVASGMITKSLAHEQIQDMKHDRFEVINDSGRRTRLKFNDKKRYGNHRSISFMPQE